jgi:hypothetical protein
LQKLAYTAYPLTKIMVKTLRASLIRSQADYSVCLWNPCVLQKGEIEIEKHQRTTDGAHELAFHVAWRSTKDIAKLAKEDVEL